MLPSTLLSGLALVGAVWAVVGQGAYQRDNVGTVAARTGMPPSLGIDKKKVEQLVSEPPDDPRSDPLSLLYDPRFDASMTEYDHSIADDRSPNYQPITEYHKDMKTRERMKELTGFTMKILSLDQSTTDDYFPNSQSVGFGINTLGSVEFDSIIEKINRGDSGTNMRTVVVPVASFQDPASHVEAIRAWLDQRDDDMNYKNRNAVIKTRFITRHDPLKGLDAVGVAGALSDGKLTENGLKLFDQWYMSDDMSARVPLQALSDEALAVLVAAWMNKVVTRSNQHAVIGGDDSAPLPGGLPGVDSILKSIARVYASSFNDTDNASRSFPFSTEVKVERINDDLKIETPNDAKLILYTNFALFHRKFFQKLIETPGTVYTIDEEKIDKLSNNIQKLRSFRETTFPVVPPYAVGQNHGLYLVGWFLANTETTVPNTIPYIHEMMHILAEMNTETFWVDQVLAADKNPNMKTILAIVDESLQISKWTAISMMCVSKNAVSGLESLNYAEIAPKFVQNDGTAQDIDRTRDIGPHPNANSRPFTDDPIAFAKQGRNVVVSLSEVKIVEMGNTEHIFRAVFKIISNYLSEPESEPSINIKILVVKDTSHTGIDWENNLNNLNPNVGVIYTNATDIQKYMSMTHAQLTATNVTMLQGNAIQVTKYAYNHYPPPNNVPIEGILSPLCISFINIVPSVQNAYENRLIRLIPSGGYQLDTWVADLSNSSDLDKVLKYASFVSAEGDEYKYATDEVALKSSFDNSGEFEIGICRYTELSNAYDTTPLSKVHVHFFSSGRFVKMNKYDWSLRHVERKFKDIDSVLSHQLIQRVSLDSSKVVYRVDVDMRRDGQVNQPYGGVISMLLMNKAAVIQEVPFVLEPISLEPPWSVIEISTEISSIIQNPPDPRLAISYTFSTAPEGSVLRDPTRKFDAVEIRLNYESQWYLEGCEFAFVPRAMSASFYLYDTSVPLQSTVDYVISKLKSDFDNDDVLKEESEKKAASYACPYLEGPIASTMRRRVIANRNSNSYLLYWKHPKTLFWSSFFATPVNKMFRDLRRQDDDATKNFIRMDDNNETMYPQYTGDSTVYGSAKSDMDKLNNYLLFTST